MRFGLAFASSIGTGQQSAIEISVKAETAGFDSVWGGEHVICPDDIESKYPYSEDGSVPMTSETDVPDPLIWLAYVGAAAPTLKLGTCILIVPQRNPLVLAKELATLDHLTGGRVELGIGVGWMREEFEALGIPWERRGARNDEYIAAMRALWAGPHAEFHGEFVDFDPLWSWPKPVQPGGPKVLLGAQSKWAFDRVVDYCDGWMPIGLMGGIDEGVASLRAACERAGRDFDSLHNALFAAPADVDACRKLLDQGFSELGFALPSADREKVLPLLDRYAELARKLR